VVVLVEQGMPVSAHDVAEELRRRLPDVGVLKLHKLLYYAQGWHLIWADRPLFREPIVAWVNGPVVRELWVDERHERGRPRPQGLDGDELRTIEYVVERYGRFSGKDLIRLTHAEDPWRDVSESDDPNVTANPTPEISHDALRRWFERDEEQVAHVAAVERLRGRANVYSFAPPRATPAVEAAVARAITGQRVRHNRPE
jgi:uncharacterized phage-associated protein